ncbi:hypothetical protein [Sulfobacillus sp. hq2]|uniref:hypothetical protein n=1 Tax=Sulfobacillus TaxID=28033 RepID=UPI000CD04939|nr:hypothetical protein [Sulfobacillus sp. hq2]POB12319.1 hypothetical protein CO251_00180 [Sulfobacillus sp. hq2]
MYCLRRLTDPAAIRAAITQPPPFGPGWDATAGDTADTLEIWGTTFADPVDYVSFRLLHGSQIVREMRLPGY